MDFRAFMAMFFEIPLFYDSPCLMVDQTLRLALAYHWPPPTWQGIQEQWCVRQNGTLLALMDPNLWWEGESPCHNISRKMFRNLFPRSRTDRRLTCELQCWTFQIQSWFFGLHCLPVVAIPEKTLDVNDSEELHSFWPGHPHWNNCPDGWKRKCNLLL